MKALVTGGGGFLGKAIVKKLLARGDDVRSFSRGDYPELRDMGAETARGDLASSADTLRAAEGCDVVFHAAARAGYWGKYEDFYAANVTATENVISACREHGISRLVYTSTPSVVIDGKDIEGADESLPYLTSYKAHYPHTKAIAERKALAASDDSLGVVSLRPHVILGPGDHHFVPRLVSRARSGMLPRIGTRPNLVDTVYVDNAADAHLLAGDRLYPGSAIAGKVYFITNGEPKPIADIMNSIVTAAGAPPISLTVPVWLANTAAWLSETAYRTLRLPGEPRLTRWLVSELSTAHWFSIDAARRDLGYEPAVSFDEGIERLRQWLDEYPVA